MRQTIRYAWVQSLPVLFGYVFLGCAFGILMEEAGYHFWWSALVSVVVYAGSMQFVLVPFLSAGTALPTVAAMTLFVNSRHLFYGLSFVEKFKKMGKKGLYMIFSLTDETYSVLCSLKAPEGVDEKKASFLISLLNQCYWVLGSVAGGLIGQLLPVDFTGIDFSMTALFVVILLEQWRTFPSHIPAAAGMLSALLFLLLFGPDRFLLPSLAATVFVLLLCRRQIAKQLEGETK